VTWLLVALALVQLMLIALCASVLEQMRKTREELGAVARRHMGLERFVEKQLGKTFLYRSPRPKDTNG
jgi:hypothetical protein